MDTTIWKFTASTNVTGDANVSALFDAPRGAQILTADFNSGRDELTAWAVVDPEAPRTPLRVVVLGTGWPMGPVGRHIKSHGDGPYVWHIFEAAVTE